MTERFAIDLPKEVTEAERDAFVASLREIDEIDRADVLGTRAGVDLATISIGVQLATQIGSLVKPVLEKIIELARGRAIKGVEITLPGGAKIAVDEISGKDLQQILAAAGKK